MLRCDIGVGCLFAKSRGIVVGYATGSATVSGIGSTLGFITGSALTLLWFRLSV